MHPHDNNPYATEERSSWSGFLFPDLTSRMVNGHLIPSFRSLADVDAWAETNGQASEVALRVGVERKVFEDSESEALARIWLTQQDMKRVATLSASQLQLAADSVKAAQRSANWTMWAAVAAAIGSVVTAASFAWGIFSPQAQPQPHMAPPSHGTGAMREPVSKATAPGEPQLKFSPGWAVAPGQPGGR